MGRKYRMIILSLCFSLLLGFSFVGETIKAETTTPTQVTIKIPKLKARRGKMIDVPIEITNRNSFNVLDFTIKFDEQRLQYQGVKLAEDPMHPVPPSVSDNIYFNTKYIPSGSIPAPTVGEGTIRMVALADKNAYYTHKEFAIITFKVQNYWPSPGFESDSTELKLTVNKLADVQVTSTATSGTPVDPDNVINSVITNMDSKVEELKIEITNLISDMDNDGKTDVVDALIILKAYNKEIALNELQKKEADVTGDGEITLEDVLEVLKRCLEEVPTI